MAKIGLVRVDDRLIHGQVVTTWINHTQSNRIIIVDDELVKNEFLAGIYAMAAPRGLPVDIKSTDQAAREWEENELGSGTVLVLFKNITTLKAAYEKGFKFCHAQIAGQASGPGKQLVFKAIGLSKQEASYLKELSESGGEVIFQSMPEEKSANLQAIISKFFKDLS